jgi:hypothetical protein
VHRDEGLFGERAVPGRYVAVKHSALSVCRGERSGECPHPPMTSL